MYMGKFNRKTGKLLNYKPMYRKRKKGKKRKQFTQIIRQPVGFPNKYLCKMKFISRYNTTAASGGVIFRANSLYDPPYSASTDQPLYFDELSLVYGRYRVFASKIKVESTLQTADSDAYVTVYPTIYTSTPTNFVDKVAQPYSKSGPVSNEVGGIITNYMQTHKLFGLKKQSVMIDEEFSGGSGDPAKIWYWNIYMESSNGVASVAWTALVTITYYCQWDRRVVLQDQ